MSSIPVYPDGDIRYAIEVNRGWFAENGVVVGDTLLEDIEEVEIDLTEVKDKKGKGSGTKDACYHKVKSRYSVWPSAYASGALVKCRKVGAANWGNSRKEEYVPEEAPRKAPFLGVSGTIGGKSGHTSDDKEKAYTKRAGDPKNIKSHYDWRDEMVEHHKKDADGNTIPHENEDIQEMDGKLMPSNPKFKGVGATKKSNPIPVRTNASYDYPIKSVAVPKNASPAQRAGIAARAKKGAEDTKKDIEAAKNVMKTDVPAYDSQAKTHSIVGSIKDGGVYNFTRQRAGAINKRVVATAGKGNKDKSKYMKDHYNWRQDLEEKCWPGYEKKGMKTMFGKRYPNCVKKSKKKK